MAIKTKIVCDNCKAEEDQYIFDEPKEFMRHGNAYLGSYIDYTSTCDTPVGWYTLDKMSLQHRVKDDGKLIKDKNKFICGDPHFCCKECLMVWLRETINGI